MQLRIKPRIKGVQEDETPTSHIECQSFKELDVATKSRTAVVLLTSALVLVLGIVFYNFVPRYSDPIDTFCLQSNMTSSQMYLKLFNVEYCNVTSNKSY